MQLHSFPRPFKALVIGATGALGAAFVSVLESNPDCSLIAALHRQSQPPIDFDREESIAEAAQTLAVKGPFNLIINAAGILHSSDFMPEKRLADVSYHQMMETFRANAFGPALVMRHFSKLLDNERGVMAILSAKVGSIGDNRLGGWYSYRASKAALNMFIKTAAIEINRTKPGAVLIALHPGTVNSRLSEPFRGAQIGRTADAAARDMLDVIDKLTAADTGRFYAYNGATLPW
ncbi:SDR family NAD(P)-dependent oxidoreductase [Glaciimonas sp. PAMC28666]|uniref:SDR family NAD(P)-dependent oxidoreductase n=1 Tax=Glaciimonas sp. PAMC28666 TaxID=2807626 RepID=UPI00196585AA|nr:SDR family NAD(P)-dependent oxidoreductase [Glaciimonas sp. PAMC28666]QRX82403.1 SDR family NAD(P)-dependent oxidoreductase [Glaciimonas sp. PAMC28666]